MTDQNNESTEPSPTPVVSVEDKVKMLQDWISLIQKDIDAIQLVRDKEYDVYAKQKKMYDEWLAKRWKIVSRYDKKIRERKNQIAEIDVEIAVIQQRPTPGVLPPLPVDVETKRTKWKKTTHTVDTVESPRVDEIPADIELSTEERAQLNKEAQSTP